MRSEHRLFNDSLVNVHVYFLMNTKVLNPLCLICQKTILVIKYYRQKYDGEHK